MLVRLTLQMRFSLAAVHVSCLCFTIHHWVWFQSSCVRPMSSDIPFATVHALSCERCYGCIQNLKKPCLKRPCLIEACIPSHAVESAPLLLQCCRRRNCCGVLTLFVAVLQVARVLLRAHICCHSASCGGKAAVKCSHVLVQSCR